MAKKAQRTQVMIDYERKRALRLLSAEEGKTLSEIVCEAIDLLRERRKHEV